MHESRYISRMRFFPKKRRYKILIFVVLLLGLTTHFLFIGQSCGPSPENIKARAVAISYEYYKSETKIFKAQYSFLPGDAPNATLLWGKNATRCPNDLGEPSSTGTCNGNGDGKLEGQNEALEFWHQLQLAGLAKTPPQVYGHNFIEQDIWSGLPYIHFAINQPVSLFGFNLWHKTLEIKTAWNVGYVNDRNAFIFAGQTQDGSYTAPVMKPIQAYNIDSKLDDGSPNIGLVQVLNTPGCIRTNTGQAAYSTEREDGVCALSIRID